MLSELVKMDYDLIFIGGSPGSGKTTVSKLLYGRLDHPPLVDFGILREPHLERDWSNWSRKEESMAFENLVFMLKNYARNGYRNVIVNDLQDHRVRQIPKRFSGLRYIIISLVVDDDKELKRRVLGERDSGFKDVKAALDWNRKLIKRKAVKNEFKLDNAHGNPNATVERIIELMNGTGRGTKSRKR